MSLWVQSGGVMGFVVFLGLVFAICRWCSRVRRRWCLLLVGCLGGRVGGLG